MTQPYTLGIAMSVIVVGAASTHASTPINPSLTDDQLHGICSRWR